MQESARVTREANAQGLRHGLSVRSALSHPELLLCYTSSLQTSHSDMESSFCSMQEDDRLMETIERFGIQRPAK